MGDLRKFTSKEGSALEPRIMQRVEDTTWALGPNQAAQTLALLLILSPWLEYLSELLLSVK